MMLLKLLRPLITGFNEQFYQETNPDVKKLCSEGKISSGLSHFLSIGHVEGRDYKIDVKTWGDWLLLKLLPVSRKQIILKNIDKSKPGLEMGPSHRPIAPKSEGFNVKIIDHASKDELIEKYASHNLNLKNIEDVDYVWKGDPLQELVGELKFDWVIASHMIEHVPDLITFLKDCESILASSGILSLAIPDKRYCFDKLRTVSTVSDCIREYSETRKSHHSFSKLVDFYYNVVNLNGKIAWDDKELGSESFVHSKEDIYKAATLISRNEYVDIHAWVFTPASFMLLIQDLNELGYVSMGVSGFTDTIGHEFYVQLSKIKTKIEKQDRRKLIKKMLVENSNAK